jgi:hypothetical protein
VTSVKSVIFHPHLSPSLPSVPLDFDLNHEGRTRKGEAKKGGWVFTDFTDFTYSVRRRAAAIWSRKANADLA